MATLCLSSKKPLKNPGFDSHSISQLDFSRIHLYGRQKEQALIHEAIRQSCLEGGSMQLVLVSGCSGSGKSSLIRSIRTNNDSGLFFCEGKFHEFASEAWQGVVRACDELCRCINKSSQKIEMIQKIRNELKNDVEHLYQMIPELSNLMTEEEGKDNEGKLRPISSKRMPSTREISGREFGFTKLKTTFRRFLQVVSSRSHPIVFFIDDVQRADASSLQLLQALFARPDQLQGLTVILSYRSNEVGSTHPLTMLLHRMMEFKIGITKLQVNNLSVENLSEMVVDLTRAEEEPARSLAKVLHQKTNGNPFFVIQLFELLQKEQLLRFSTLHFRWEWDVDKIQSATSISDNVVELVATKLRRLPKTIQDALSIGACLGSRFHAVIVSAIHKDGSSTMIENFEQDGEENHSSPGTGDVDFELAVKESILIRMGETAWYIFSHDRIQQGAYALLPEGAHRQRLHLRIGSQLRVSFSSNEPNDEWVLLVAADQLNRGSMLVDDDNMRLELARINMEAAKVMNAKSAFHAAVKFLECGRSQLQHLNGWKTYRDLTRELHDLLARMYYCTGNLESARDAAMCVLDHSMDVLDKVEAYQTLMLCQNNQNDNMGAMQVGREALAKLGEPIPSRAYSLRAYVEFFRLQSVVAGLSDDDLLGLPSCTDPKKMAALKVMGEMLVSNFALGREGWLVLLVLRQMRLSILFGVVDGVSPVAFALFGAILTHEDNDEGYRFGVLGLQLADRMGDMVGKARAQMMCCWLLTHLKNPVYRCLEPLMESHQNLMEAGDVDNGMLSLVFYTDLYIHCCGLPLAPLLYDYEKYTELCDDYQQTSNASVFRASRFFAQRLVSEVDAEKELQMIKDFESEDNSLALIALDLSKFAVAIFFNDLNLCKFMVKKIDFNEVMFESPSYIYISLCFYQAVANFSLAPTSKRRRRRVQKGNHFLRQLESSLRKGNPNIHSLVMLLRALRISLEEADTETVKAAFDKAIRSSSRSGFCHYVALGNERAGLYFLGVGDKDWADYYLRAAHKRYVEWGAKAKARQMAEEHKILFERTRLPSERTGHNAAIHGQRRADKKDFTAIHERIRNQDAGAFS